MGSAEPLARLQDVDLAPYLADDLLTKTDRMSMAHSPEVRVPFPDRHVDELAFALAAWLRGPLLPMARDLLAPAAIARAGALDPAPVTRLLDEHVARRDDHSRALSGLLCFVLWQQGDAAR